MTPGTDSQRSVLQRKIREGFPGKVPIRQHGLEEGVKTENNTQ